MNKLLVVLAFCSLLTACHAFPNILFNPTCPLQKPGSDYTRATCSCESRLDGRGSTISCMLWRGVDFYRLMKEIEEGSVLIDSLELRCSHDLGGLGTVFRKLPKLRAYHLKLSSCDISSMDMAVLEESAFWLEHLDLSYNKLSETDMKNLHLLYHLKTLNLKGNRFTSIPDGTFAHNPDLEMVDLSYNYGLIGIFPIPVFGGKSTKKIKKAFPGRADVTVEF